MGNSRDCAQLTSVPVRCRGIFSFPQETYFSTQRLVYIGLRDVDEPEQEIIDERGILEYPMPKVL